MFLHLASIFTSDMFGYIVRDGGINRPKPPVGRALAIPVIEDNLRHPARIPSAAEVESFNRLRPDRTQPGLVATGQNNCTGAGG
ncbi:uncharacterized protein CLUP02_03647 [Colletotrichum lupini]|uniref:Uncharacterized protein n=1 Tax=Colletotrichum lupini TaxID=145971 RepID=A0A9Q8WCY2_9PEZI|nr:uncharacterized protein CLUP02_03647 [Colletotrichum lupini]UQC78172.1 hypothetical protein CLUP02_03647 [Colletotrichum lupini]